MDHLKNFVTYRAKSLETIVEEFHGPDEFGQPMTTVTVVFTVEGDVSVHSANVVKLHDKPVMVTVEEIIP